MSNLKRNINRFFLKNRDKGIPNLMLYICAGNAVVYLFWRFFNEALPSYLFFDAALVMQGQVWRLFSFVFTFACGPSFLFSTFIGAVFSILFYFWIGRTLETVWGTARFNAFYLSGIILSDLYALLLYWIFGAKIIMSSHYINLSMFLAVATLIPEQRIYLMMIIPIKMKWLAWFDIGVMLYGVVSGLIDAILVSSFGPVITVTYVLAAFFPLVALANYALFFGRNMKNLLPTFSRSRRKKTFTSAKTDAQPNPNWANKYRSASGERPYRHKCTVCGRTDTDCPDLEFRYCSKCAGYFCYCIDHINNHTHVQ